MNPITSYDYSTADYTSLASAGESYSTTEFTRVTTSLEQNDENEQDVHEQVMLGSWNEGDDEGIAGNVDDPGTKMFS